MIQTCKVIGERYTKHGILGKFIKVDLTHMNEGTREFIIDRRFMCSIPNKVPFPWNSAEILNFCTVFIKDLERVPEGCLELWDKL